MSEYPKKLVSDLPERDRIRLGNDKNYLDWMEQGEDREFLLSDQSTGEIWSLVNPDRAIHTPIYQRIRELQRNVEKELTTRDHSIKSENMKTSSRFSGVETKVSILHDQMLKAKTRDEAQDEITKSLIESVQGLIQVAESLSERVGKMEAERSADKQKIEDLKDEIEEKDETIWDLEVEVADKTKDATKAQADARLARQSKERTDMRYIYSSDEPLTINMIPDSTVLQKSIRMNQNRYLH
jgi:hypothetical protein